MASTRGEEKERKKKQSATRSRETHLFAAETCRGTSARGGTSRPRARACRAGTTSNPPGPGASPRCRRSNASRTAGKKQSQVSFVFSVFSPFARRADGKSLQREIFACRCGADTGGGDGGGGRAGARDGDLRGDRDRPRWKSMRQRASRGGARVGSRRTRRRRGRGRAERARRARKRRALETVCAPEQVPVLDVGGEGVSPLVGAPSAARGERVDVLRGANLLGGG